MEKRVETALVSLQKMADKASDDLGEVSAQVDAEIDHSGSMDELYRRGTVQEAVERALALSMTGLDDDKVVPVYFYDDRVYDRIDATEDSYAGLVDRFRGSHAMGGTRYSPVIAKVLEGEDRPQDPPHLHLFFTDGAPAESDKPLIEQLLVQARTRPHFFQFVMLGTDQRALAYLGHLNNQLDGPGVDNVGVTIYHDPATVDDAEFFDDIVSEFFPIWLPQARRAGYTA